MRRTKEVTIAAEGRDKGKVYVLTEMAPTRAEKWAARMFLAMGRSGIDVPDEISRMGLAGLVGFGIRAFGALQFSDAEPLMDEMMECVQIRTNEIPRVVRKLMTDDDVEEVGTFFALRKEVFELHTGFSMAGLLSAFQLPAAPTEGDTPNTSTSQGRSAPSSQADSPPSTS